MTAIKTIELIGAPSHITIKGKVYNKRIKTSSLHDAKIYAEPYTSSNDIIITKTKVSRTGHPNYNTTQYHIYMSEKAGKHD